MMIHGNKRVRAGVAGVLALSVSLLASSAFAADPAPAAGAAPAAPAGGAAPVTPAPGAPADAAKPADGTAPAATDTAAPKADEEPKEEKDYDEGIAGPLRFGPLVSLGVPRTVGLGITAKYKRYLGFGIDYSFIPTGLLPLGEVDFSSWSFKGYGRFYPFKGAFYLSLGLGYQTTSVSYGTGANAIEASIGAPMVTAALGWFWTWKMGLGFGLELGATIPFSSSSEFSGPGILSDAKGLKDVTDTLDLIGSTPLPQIELIKLGFLF